MLDCAKKAGDAAGRVEGFLIASALWAVSNACIGATPAAYAADVMPQNVSGLGLGIYRCAGDLGTNQLTSLSAACLLRAVTNI